MLAALALLALSARAETVIASRTFRRAEVRSLSIATEAGAIEVRGVAAGDVRVEAVRPGNSKGHCQLVAEAEGGRLSLQARLPDGESGRCDAGFRVEAPRPAALEAYAGSGKVSVASLRGETKIRTASGAVSLDDVEAPAHVMTGSGSVDVRATRTPWLDVRTGAGDVSLRLGSGSSTVSVRTGSGAIKIRLPKGAKARVKAQSPGGQVSDTVPSAAAAVVSIEALSGSGDVSIRPR